MAALLIGCLLIQVAWPLATLPFHLSWDYGEGWNAYWAARAMAGAPLYTAAASPITDNYPPLSFFLFGAAGQLIGDTIVGGRILSLLALLGCAAAIATLVARLGGGLRWGTATAAAFLTYVASFAWRYFGSDDPQWLAAGFTLGALLMLAWDRHPSAARLVGAAALLILGGLVKHNQLAAPIAVTLWLAATDRRALGIWLAAGAGLAAVAVAGLHHLFGPLLFEEVLHHDRLFKARYFLTALGSVSGLLPEMALAAMTARRLVADGRDARPLLLLLFAGVGMVLGMVERFGTGVSVNAHFDGLIGLMLVAGVALGRADLLDPARRWRMAGLCLLPLLCATVGMLPHTVERFAGLGNARARWATAIDRIRAAPGPVACELPALCFWAGKPFAVDFFNYGQKLRIAGDPARLGEAIAGRRFALMAVVRDRRMREGDGRLPDAYNRLIERNYRPFLTLPDDTLLLLPRSGTG